MSDNLYMTVCSKTVLFRIIGQMNNFFNHIDGIKVFSCTEPPSGKRDRVSGVNRGPEKEIIFFSGVRKNGTRNIRLERWLDGVYGNSINHVPWGWGLFF